MAITGASSYGATINEFVAHWESANEALGGADAITVAGGVGVAGSNARLARAERNALQDDIYPILKQYRRVVPSLFPPNSVFAVTLPRLTPLPGHTPAPVEASAAWDAERGRAKIAWEGLRRRAAQGVSGA